MKALIVGAGIAGLTAGVLLKRKGWDVDVLERRLTVGGNCADYPYNDLYVHVYGPHIFHTNDERVWKFVNEFARFNNYRHEVLARTDLPDTGLLPVPYNFETADKIGKDLSDDEIRRYFFRSYTEKMWGMTYEQVPSAITGRVQLRRASRDPRYFQDKYEGLPLCGYQTMFRRMHEEIGQTRVHCSIGVCDWHSWAQGRDLVVYTGPLDEFFDLEYGRLPYRAIQFVFKRAQPKMSRAVVNYCTRHDPFTRITDYSHFYNEARDWSILGTTIRSVEYPQAWAPESDLSPSYPMRGFPEADDLLAKYMGIQPPKNTVLAGRLGAYRYMNMDVTISDTMARLEKKLGVTLYA